MISPTMDKFVDLLVGRQPAEARAAVIEMVAAGRDARSIYLDVLAPALREVGSRWQHGLATVAQEHLATAVVSSIMATMSTLLDQPPPPVAGRCVLASTDGELHDIGLRMVADFLEADGWDVLYLGAAVPMHDLILLVDDVRPAAVGLSTTLTTHLAVAETVIAQLKASVEARFVVVGGRAYGDDPAVASRIGADAFATDAGTASRALRERFAHA